MTCLLSSAILLATLVAGAGPEISVVVDPAAKQSSDDLLHSATAAGATRVLGSAAMDRAKLAQLAEAAAHQGKAFWPLLPLCGPSLALADTYCARPAGAGAPLAGLPCYAYPQARQALHSAAARLLELPGQGIFLLVDGPLAWPEGRSAALDFGYNQPVLDEYARRYGGDPRSSAAESLARMFFLRLKGEHLAEAIRGVAQAAHARSRRVGLAVALSETNVRTAVHAYLDAEGLRALAYKTIDEVALIDAWRVNLLGWKVQAEPAPRTAFWVGASAAGRPWHAAVAAALENGSADGLIVAAAQPRDWGQIPAAAAAWQTQQTERARFRAELAEGRYKLLAGTAEKKTLDVATTHGVGQSFRLARPALVSAVRLLVALRARPDDDLADLRLELRGDRHDQPAGPPIATANISRYAVTGVESNYQWVAARLHPPVRLEANCTYWLHVPPVKGYVWRFDRSNPYGGGHAWSRQYDYRHGDWLFEVLGVEEPQ